ncbi:argininosuccinate lyase [Fulvivirgaceae bacterium BMA10]|uniref:Argininosuccinate lyase n=1 Tax=Splendidivirga corallicola TaxID=3051826 RepID=A0ABT8KLJ6_9BACT|nr:argininosuccinate lyase [Fulvivirgaceae bacterium BMA10]
MKLWEKEYKVEDVIETFTVGNDRELDIVLAKYDVQGSLAHAKMLEHIGILNREELASIEAILNELLQEIDTGQFEIESEFEDVHSKVEFVLTKKLGEAGKKIHTGRSRNDQILVDMHLFLKEEINSIKALTKVLFDELIQLSEKYKDEILPGYTHLQVAMPSSFGLWFGAYAESLVEDIHVLNAAYKVVDQNPLGSGAGYGSSFPLDRTMTTALLGFSTLKYNSVAAQMNRGKSEKVTAYGLATLGGTLSKMAMDVCLYMSQNFGFISFPDELTTGSSIMPHKKNPDVFELIRAKCNKIQALPYELSLITNNLPSGYHRDYQLLKESLLPAIDGLKSCLEMAVFMFRQIIVKKDFLHDPKYDYMYSVEEVNKEVQNGLPFRDAYKKVGKNISAGNYKPQRKIKHTHEGSIGNLCSEEIKLKFKKAFEE